LKKKLESHNVIIDRAPK